MEPAPGAGLELRLLFDQLVSGPALRRLRECGVDVLHVGEVGLSEADDPAIFHWATRERRVIVTRNYCDFAPLVEAFARKGDPFPGVLFYPSSIAHSDVNSHVRALLGWVAAAERFGRNPVESTFGWLQGGENQTTVTPEGAIVGFATT
jgi:predicted nuclease of predicted toxin-antitoxin system